MLVLHRRATSSRATRAERGATAIEYALLVALIAGVIIGVIIVLGGKVFGLYDVANAPNW